MSEIRKGKMINIKLTEEQFVILQEFLSRAQLSGKEVPAYVDLINALHKGEGSAEQNGE